jgi:hypothetical protein
MHIFSRFNRNTGGARRRPSTYLSKVRYRCPMCGHEEEEILPTWGHKKCRLCGNEAMRRLHFEGGKNRDARGDKISQT